MGIYLDHVYCKKCGKILTYVENVEAYNDYLFLCHTCKVKTKKRKQVTK